MSLKIEHIQWLQKKVVYLLYIAMAFKLAGEFVPVLNFVSGILIAIFFIAELFLLPPVTMVVVCIVVSILFFFLPAMVGLLLGMLTASLVVSVIAGALCCLLSSVTFTFLYGALMSVQVTIVSAPATLAAGIATGVVAVSTTMVAAAYAAVDTIGVVAERKTGRAILAVLCNVLIFIVICWPILSYSGTINGAMAFKPAVILNQAHMNYLNVGASEEYKEKFEDETKWAFTNNFYNENIRSSNNNIVQGKKDLIAGNEHALAVLLNGLLYVQDATMENHIGGAAYLPKETDALVLNGTWAFIFGHNRIFMCGSEGDYMWKDTQYTTTFENLSWDEKCEYIYDILERQNTDEFMRFSYDEVGSVAYAQRNGLLLNYNRNTHTAFFAKESDNGQITVFSQSSANARTEQVTFDTDKSHSGQTYVMAGADGILCLSGNHVIFLEQSSDWSRYNSFTHPDGDVDFRSIHYGWVGKNSDVYSAYADTEGKIWLDTRNIGKNGVTSFSCNIAQTKAIGFAGDYIYSIQYDDNLISRLTYIYDVSVAKKDPNASDTSGYRPYEIWMEAWAFQRIKLDSSILSK